jgi:hypothetical protein
MKKLILLLLLCGVVSAEWRQKHILVQTIIEHQMIPEYDTVMVRHYHKVDNKFYIITVDSIELWVDDLKELRK